MNQGQSGFLLFPDSFWYPFSAAGYLLSVLKLQKPALAWNVPLNCKHQDRAINLPACTHTPPQFSQLQTHSFHADWGSMWSFHVTVPKKRGNNDPKSVENVIFLGVWAQRNFTLDSHLHSVLLHHTSFGKNRASRGRNMSAAFHIYGGMLAVLHNVVSQYAR